jgi:hypothetical protein
MKYLCVEYANSNNLSDFFVLRYRLRDNPVVPLWINKVLAAQQQYSIDDPARFYGFGTLEQQQQWALDRLNHNITVIKLELNDLQGKFVKSVDDQNQLNYWHNVFEVYHGLLGVQNLKVSETTRDALADLNVCVHRCESVARGAQPRHVVTWYGLPKTDTLSATDYNYFENSWSAGTVFLNYAEIGKTMIDLATDRDSYIGDKAFQPFRHYSADFVVQLYEKTTQQGQQEIARARQYHMENQKRFGPWEICYQPGSVPMADLTTPLDLSIIETHQYVKSVSFE